MPYTTCPRCGFLGMLHMEIFVQRLQHEYGAAVVATTPTVPYTLEMAEGTTVTLISAAEYPLDKKVSKSWGGGQGGQEMCGAQKGKADGRAE